MLLVSSTRIEAEKQNRQTEDDYERVHYADKYLFLKAIAMEQRWDLVIPRQGDQLSDVLPKHFVSGISMKEKKTSTVLIKIMASK